MKLRRNSHSRFVFRADDPCLDFLNTEIYSRPAGRREDLLKTFSDLLGWMVEAGLLAHGSEAKLRNRPAKETSEALSLAIGLRATLRRSAETLTEGRHLHQSALDDLNRLLRENPSIEQLEVTNGKIEKRRIAQIERPSDVLQPLAEAAADLLAGPRASLIRRCEGPQCILFFLDTTKNHTRRWCSMQGCGNRVKVAEHRKRLAG